MSIRPTSTGPLSDRSLLRHLVPEFRKALKNRPPKSQETYFSVYRNHIKPRFADTPIGDITPFAVEDMHGELAVDMPSTANYALAVLSTFYKVASKLRIPVANPTKGITRARIPENPKPLPPGIESRVRDYLNGSNEHGREVLLLMLELGLRRAEAVVITPAMIKPPQDPDDPNDHGAVVIPRLNMKNREEFYRPFLSKRERQVTLALAETETKYRYRDTDKLWNRIRAKFDIDSGPHCLRHTAATRAVREGVDPRFVSLALGHRSPTSINAYLKITPTMVREGYHRAAQRKTELGL